MADAAKSTKRVRKATSTYTPEAPTEDKERDIPPGRGSKLGDLPNVVSNFSEVTWSNPHLRMLHTIALGVGKKKEFKPNLLRFSGLVYPEGKEEAERQRVRSKIMKLWGDDLKSVMDLADVERGPESFDKKNPTKEMLCERFLGWLEEPKDSGRGKRKMRTLKGAAKGGRASGSGGKKRKTPAKKSTKKKKPEGAGKKKPADNSDNEATDNDDTEAEEEEEEEEVEAEEEEEKEEVEAEEASDSSDDSAPTPPKKPKKTPPSKKKSSKQNGSSSKKGPKKKKKESTGTKPPSAAAVTPPCDIDLNIPGASLDQVRAKVKSIINTSDKNELTVKGVRKLLEDWLDADLGDRKDTVRALVMEAMKQQ